MKLVLNFSAVLIGLMFFSCKPDKTEQSPVEAKPVKIVTDAMDFKMPDTISAGWNAFEYVNNSTEPHFFLIEIYPEGKTLEDAKEKVVIPFQNGMNKIMEGKGEEAGAEFAKLPEWYGEVKFLGGSGIISPGMTSHISTYLEPGYYLMECYMKMRGGMFHTSMGMITDFVVVDKDNATAPVDTIPDYTISLSSQEGIVISDSILSNGTKVFKVNFLDQIVHENFVGHDINLARVSEQANIDSLEYWMNWANPDGLLEQAPQGVVFLGGINDMPGGSSAYFKAELEKGKNYVLISEVPNTRSKNMLVQFTVE